MVVDVSKITEDRQAERDAAREHSQDAAVALELRYIADALEAIRGELAGLSQLVGTAARGKSAIS